MRPYCTAIPIAMAKISSFRRSHTVQPPTVQVLLVTEEKFFLLLPLLPFFFSYHNSNKSIIAYLLGLAIQGNIQF